LNLISGHFLERSSVAINKSKLLLQKMRPILSTVILWGLSGSEVRFADL
jgi:hypothetical protein